MLIKTVHSAYFGQGIFQGSCKPRSNYSLKLLYVKYYLLFIHLHYPMNNIRTLYFDFHWQTSKHFAMDIVYTATRLNHLRCPLRCKADLGSMRPSPRVSLRSFPWAACAAL